MTIHYTFNGTSSTLIMKIGEVTTHFEKVSETGINISVELQHYPSGTKASYTKSIVLQRNGVLHHYPIKGFAVAGVEVGEHNTLRKYFTHILGPDGYQEYRKQFLYEFQVRQEMELSWFLKRVI